MGGTDVAKGLHLKLKRNSVAGASPTKRRLHAELTTRQRQMHTRLQTNHLPLERCSGFQSFRESTAQSDTS